MARQGRGSSGRDAQGGGKAQGANGGEAISDGALRQACFEEEFRRAELAAERLERGDLPLEEALAAYEDGLRALRACHATLAAAEKRVEALAGDLGSILPADSGPVWQAAASVPGLRPNIEAVDRSGELPATKDAPSAEET